MPIHDWSSAESRWFQAFRQGWLGALRDILNVEWLPDDLLALVEEASEALDVWPADAAAPHPSVGHLPPGGLEGTKSVSGLQESHGAGGRRPSDWLAVRHHEGRLVAVVAIVSPEDKATEAAVQRFVRAIARLVGRGVHVLIVDLFPPGDHDPKGIHNAIWDELEEEDLAVPADRPLLAASYDAGPIPVTYVEPFSAGDILPEMPLFLEPGCYIPTPLEAAYQAAWDRSPTALRSRVGAAVPEGV